MTTCNMCSCTGRVMEKYGNPFFSFLSRTFAFGREMATLIEAVKDRNVERVRDLLATGANADETDTSGRAALYFAAQRGLIEIARCLLNRGARTSLQTNWGSTPLHVAADKGFDDLLRLLTRAQDANANIQNKNGDTALHLAAYRGKLDAVRVLLDAGADVALVNGEGRTAIEDSESNGHYQVADCLKAHLATRYRRGEIIRKFHFSSHVIL